LYFVGVRAPLQWTTSCVLRIFDIPATRDKRATYFSAGGVPVDHLLRRRNAVDQKRRRTCERLSTIEPSQRRRRHWSENRVLYVACCSCAGAGSLLAD
jgi:hypothetical protein